MSDLHTYEFFEIFSDHSGFNEANFVTLVLDKYPKPDLIKEVASKMGWSGVLVLERA